MKSRIHHAALNVADLDWYRAFFEQVFDMTIERVAGEPPSRKIWFLEGIQLDETAEAADVGNIVGHVSIGVEDIPGTVERAVGMGCTRLPNGAHWFALPNGVKMELKPLR